MRFACAHGIPFKCYKCVFDSISLQKREREREKHSNATIFSRMNREVALQQGIKHELCDANYACHVEYSDFFFLRLHSLVPIFIFVRWFRPIVDGRNKTDALE